MSAAEPFGDQEEELGDVPSLGSLGELEDLYEEPIEIDVGEDEDVGLDAAAFDAPLEEEELVGFGAGGSSRFDDEPIEIEDDDDSLVPADGEYGLCEGLEPTNDLEDDFAPLTGLAPTPEDGGEDGLPQDDGSMDRLDLPPLDREPPTPEDAPEDPWEELDVDDPL